MSFLVGLGAAGRNIGAPAPDRCHDAQLLGNLFKRGILWKPLKGVKDSLFVRHYQRVVPVLAAGKRALRTYNSFGDSLRFHFLPLRARVRLSVNENADSFAWLEKADGLPMRIQGSCSFGRAATNHVVLADERVSRRHAIIHTQREGEFWLLDLGSSNGTYINGRRLGKPSRLRNGDTIQIGAFQAVFRLGGRGEPDPTASRLAANQTLVATKSCPCWLLLADIEGSSGLSQRLDAETLAALIGHWLTRCKEAIEGEGGAINKYLGDGFFAYWPAAQVTPPRLVAALGALRQLQDRSEPPFRLVLHCGQVLMGGMASMGEESLLGKDVNFVFRMERLAATLGQPRLLSEEAARQLGASLTTTPVGQHPLTGFDGEHRFLSF
ncbi:MAG: FHA domain-containing protein [Limisphaerales bacterium]